MRALAKRAEEIAGKAADRKLDELARTIMEKLPRAEIERLTSSISVRELRLINRWLNDTELRFFGRGR